jgi:hypothetical protein
MPAHFMPTAVPRPFKASKRKWIFGAVGLAVLALIVGGYFVFERVSTLIGYDRPSADTEWLYAVELPEPISAVAGDGNDINANEAALGIRVQEGETRLGTRGPQLVMGDLDLHGVEVIIPAGALPAGTRVTLQTPESVPNVNSKEFEPVGAPIVISAGAEPVRLYEPVTISFRLDSDALVGVEDPRNFWAAYFDGERWQYLWADEVDLEDGVLRFTTYNFSLFGYGRISIEERLERYTHNAALAEFAQEQLDERVNNEIADAVKHILKENLGIEDESIHSKVIVSLTSDDRWGELLDSAREGDMTLFSQHLATLTGRAIVMAVPESVLSESLDLIVSDLGVDTAVAASQAAAHLADGRFFDAGEVIVTHIADQFVITTAGRIAVAAVQHQIDTWKNSQIEAAYKAYKYGAQTTFWGYNVDAGDFDAVWSQMRGIARQLVIDAIRQQNESRQEAGFEPLTPEEEDALRVRVRDDLRRQFERRKAEEETIERYRQEISEMIKLYRERRLLTEGMWGWTAAYGLEQRIDVLLHFKNRVMRDVGATTIVDGFSLHDGQLGREAIISATMAWFEGGREAYAQYLYESFGISILPERLPELQDLAGTWQGQSIVADSRITEFFELQGLFAAAEQLEQAEDFEINIHFSREDMQQMDKQMEALITRISLVLEVGENGGMFTLIAEGPEGDTETTGPYPFTYSEGSLKMDVILSQEGVGEFRWSKEAKVHQGQAGDGLSMTGTWSHAFVMPGTEFDGFILTHGTLNASKGAADGR